MNPQKKSRRCRASASIQALDLAISRFVYSFDYGETILKPCWFETRIENIVYFDSRLKKKILWFFLPFCARFASKLSKSANMTPKIFFFHNIFLKWESKNAEFDADFQKV